MTAAELLNWKAAQAKMVELGMPDLADRLFSEDRHAIIAQAGGRICGQLGWNAAVRFAEAVTVLTDGPLLEMD